MEMRKTGTWYVAVFDICDLIPIFATRYPSRREKEGEKAFNEVRKAVLAREDIGGRKRCENLRIEVYM